MSLTDQEQVVLKAIKSLLRTPTSPVLISDVVTAVGYPKATTKKVLARLAEKGVIAVHRHDYPQSLTPAERKLMLRLKDGRGNWGYYSAVSMRARNPKGQSYDQLVSGAIKVLGVGEVSSLMQGGTLHQIHRKYSQAYNSFRDKEAKAYQDLIVAWSLKPALEARQHAGLKNPRGKHLRGATAKQHRQYEAILKSIKKSGRYKGREKEVAARTVRARQNPKQASKGKTALKKTGRALKGFAQGALSSAAQILGAGAEALNPVSIRKKTYRGKQGYLISGKDSKGRSVSIFADTKKKAEDIRAAIKANDRQRVQDVLLGHTNPSKRLKVRNKYIDLVIKGQAKKTRDGWKVGKKTFAQGRGTVNVSSGYYLDRHTGMVYAKRERNTVKRKTRKRNVEMGFYDASGFHPIRASSDYSEGQRPSRSKKAKAAKRKAVATASHKRKVSSRKATARRLASRVIKKTVKSKSRRRRNISEGFYDASGTFHPIRSASDYSPAAAGETGRKPVRTRSKKRRAAKSKAASTARTKSRVRARKATTSRLAGRAIRKSAGLLKKRRGRKNPSAESIRKKFAGSVNGERDLFFPQGTPSGRLAKLGKLISITTEEGTIKPVHGTAWLCADTKGKLHIGSTTQAPLFDGPKRSFGKVSKFEYQDVKKHLGHNKQTIFFHHAGEENGVKPTLHADGRGGLVFKGGDYRITSRGVEN